MVTERNSRSSDREDDVLRALVFPEEDRAQWTTAAWSGEFRWFRSPNVVPLEKYRKLKKHVAR
jgi:hypothetical protein